MYTTRLAKLQDRDYILRIVRDARVLFKQMKSDQWSGDYPAWIDFQEDIERGILYVCLECNEVIGMGVISKEEEENYREIFEGKWINQDPYIVIHRFAVRKDYYGRGVSQHFFQFAEELAVRNHIYSIKVDTHRSNIPMQKTLLKLNFMYCGIIHIHSIENIDKIRLAYQKTLQ